MNILKGLNISSKIRRLLMLTSGIALLVAAIASVCIEFFTYRREMVENTATLAEFVVENVKATSAFDDKATATNLLQPLILR